MFRASQRLVVVNGGGTDVVIMPQLFVIIVRTPGNGAGDDVLVCFFDVAKELVEGAIGLGRNTFWHPVANPAYDRDVVRGRISILFFPNDEEEDLSPFAPGKRLRRHASSMACDPIRFWVECDPCGVIRFASPNKPVNIRVGLIPLAGCSGLLGLADAIGMVLVRVGPRGLVRLVVRCLTVVGTRDDPGIEAAAVFVPQSVAVVVPGAETSVRVCSTNPTRASVDFEDLIAAGTCNPGLLFVWRAFGDNWFLVSPSDLPASASKWIGIVGFGCTGVANGLGGFL